MSDVIVQVFADRIYPVSSPAVPLPIAVILVADRDTPASVDVTDAPNARADAPRVKALDVIRATKFELLGTELMLKDTEFDARRFKPPDWSLPIAVSAASFEGR